MFKYFRAFISQDVAASALYKGEPPTDKVSQII